MDIFVAGDCRIVIDRVGIDATKRAREIAAEFGLPEPERFVPEPVATEPAPEPERFPAHMAPIVWQTGALYTKHGQRLGAQVMDADTGLVVFTDIDRAISGTFVVSFAPRLASPESIKAAVMRAYLYNEFDHTGTFRLTEDQHAKFRELVNFTAANAPSIAS